MDSSTASKLWYKMCQCIQGCDEKTFECVADQYIAILRGYVNG